MPDNEWRKHAYKRHGTFWHVGDRRYVELHMLKDPIVEVIVREVDADSDEATHWGWIKTGTSEPRIIWPNLPCFTVCFPYGPEAEEKAGKGRTVRLAITAIGEQETA